MSEANTRWGVLYCPKRNSNKLRERLQRVLDERKVVYDFVQSESTDSVERLVSMLIHNGYKTIVIVGGDSALNDAVNCLMKEEKQVRDQIALGVIPHGVMNDFARYWDFKEGELEQTVDWLVKHRVRMVDLGCLRYTNKKGDFVQWAGIDNFVRVFKSTLFSKIMGNTFKFALMVGTGTLLFSMIFALASAARERGSRIYEVMFAIPMAVASVPASVIFEFLMKKEGGLINGILGTSIAWLQNPKWAMIAVAFVTVWLHIGSSYIFLLVGFRNVPQELIECATLDGAGPIRKALKIFIPIASPQIFFVVFLNILNSFKAFSFFKLLTGTGVGGSTDVLIYEVYKQAFTHNRYETSFVYAAVLFVVIFIVTRIQFAVEKKVVFYQ